MSADEFVAKRPYPARGLATCFSLFTLMGLTGIFAGESDGRPQPVAARWFFACMFVVCATLTIRGARAGQVSLREGQLRIRALVRTHRFAVGDVAGVEARETSLGMCGYRRNVLFVTLRNGRSVRVDDVNGPTRGRSANVIPEMVKELDECLRSLQAGAYALDSRR